MNFCKLAKSFISNFIVRPLGQGTTLTFHSY
jgi:hypothetical protein